MEVTLQWIPAHCGVHGNKSADILAKEGSGPDQHDKSVSYKNEMTIIKSLTARKWHQKHPDLHPTDGYHFSDRADQVILTRLKIGHNRMNAHMYSSSRLARRIAVRVTQSQWIASTCSKTAHSMMWSGKKHGQRTPLWGGTRLCGRRQLSFELWACLSSVRRKRRIYAIQTEIKWTHGRQRMRNQCLHDDKIDNKQPQILPQLLCQFVADLQPFFSFL